LIQLLTEKEEGMGVDLKQKKHFFAILVHFLNIRFIAAISPKR